MNTLTSTNLIHLPNNFNGMGFNDKVELLRFDFNSHANNEEILDKLFLHGKAALAEINNDQKIKIFAKLLSKNLISKKYYETQIGRYGTLQTWCRYSIFNHLGDDQNEKLNNIEKLPLPTRLKDFLKEQDIAPTNNQINSPRP